MGNTVLEQDDSQESNVETQEQQTVETQTETVKEEKQSEATAETSTESATTEQTIEIDGQQVPLSRAKEALSRYANDDKWTAKNTQKAQEIAEREREFQEKLYLASLVEKRPDIVQKLLTPAEERNVEDELKRHYTARPDGQDPAAYFQWEEKKDALLAEAAEIRAERRLTSQFASTESKRHNDDLVKNQWDVWKKDFTLDEFKQAQLWIRDNIRDDNGKYSAKAFEMARRELYGDKELSQAKLDASKKAAESIENAKHASGSMGAKAKIEQSDLSDEDRAFLDEMSARTRKAS